METDSYSFSSFSGSSFGSYDSYGSFGSYSFSDPSDFSDSFSSWSFSDPFASSPSSLSWSNSFDSSILNAYSSLSPTLTTFALPAIPEIGASPSPLSPATSGSDTGFTFDPGLLAAVAPQVADFTLPEIQVEALAPIALPDVLPAPTAAPELPPSVLALPEVAAPSLPVEVIPQQATGVGEVSVDFAPPPDIELDIGFDVPPLPVSMAAAVTVQAEEGAAAAPVAEPLLPPALVLDDKPAPGDAAESPRTDAAVGISVSVEDVEAPAILAAPLPVAHAEAPVEGTSEAIAYPVAPPAEIVSRPLPPEPRMVVAKPGDNISKIVGNDPVAIGDFALRNGLTNSTIIAGRQYDATPVDRASLTPEEVTVREQITQRFFNVDNARLAQLAAAERERQAQREAALFGRQAQEAFDRATWMTGEVIPNSFAAMATPVPSIWDNKAPALPKRFLTEAASNDLAPFAHAPGVVLGRHAFNSFGYDVNMPAGGRAAGELGNGPGVTRYEAGDISVLGINNYSVTAINSSALAGSLTARVTEGPTQGLVGSLDVNTKAQSLLTDTMFETLPNGVGKPNETLRAEIAAKYLVQTRPIAETRTDGIYAGIEKRTVTAALGSATAGVGASVEVAIPFTQNRKMGVEGSVVFDANVLESKQMSAAGSVFDPAKGIYGASFGYETRNRLGSVSTTINAGADVGFLRGKTSGQLFTSVGPIGGGGTASWAFNDNEGSLTFQATASLSGGLGGGFDLSGKFQSDAAKGIVRNAGELIDAAKSKADSLYKEYVQPIVDKKWTVSDVAHGALTGISFAPGLIGSGASALDGMLYAAEGNKEEAGWSFAGAGIGMVSSAGAAKVALKTGQAAVAAGKTTAEIAEQIAAKSGKSLEEAYVIAQKQVDAAAAKLEKRAADEALRQSQTATADLINRPYTAAGKSADDILKAFTQDGIPAVITGSNRPGSAAVFVRPDLSVSKNLSLVEVHPGGGVHGGAYVRLSGPEIGTMHIVNPKTFDPKNATSTIRNYIPIDIPIKAAPPPKP